MTSEARARGEDQTKTPAPMFADRLGPGETCYAEDIWHVNIFKVVPGEDGQDEKRRIPKRQQRVKINPYVTTDQDIADGYDDGVYYVEAIAAHDVGKLKQGSKMPGGHYIRVGEANDAVADDEEGDEEGGNVIVDPRMDPRMRGMPGILPPAPDGVAAAAITAMQKQGDAMIGMLREQATAPRTSPVKEFAEIAGILAPRQDTPAQVKALNDQLDELRRLMRKAEDRAAEDLEAERKRARQAEDDAKRATRDAVDRAERAADERIRDLRDDLKRREGEWDEKRKQLLRDVDEWREKYRKDIDRAEEDKRKDLVRSDREFEQYRETAEKRLADLEAEMLGYKRQVTELQGKLDLDRMDTERLRKERDEYKADLKDAENEIDKLKSDLEDAQKAADKSKMPPVDGMMGWALQTFGPGLMEKAPQILAVLAGNGAAPPQELPPQVQTQTATTQPAPTVVRPQPSTPTRQRVATPAPTPAQPAAVATEEIQVSEPSFAGPADVAVRLDEEHVQDPSDADDDTTPDLEKPADPGAPAEDVPTELVASG